MKLIPILMVAGLVGVAHAQSTGEVPYLAETARAMQTMMDDMNIAPTGDVDADFVAAMTPHHRGAIAMAQAELTYGHSQLLRRIAQEIIVAQSQEIEAMRLALGDKPPPGAERPSMPAMPSPPEHPHAQ